MRFLVLLVAAVAVVCALGLQSVRVGTVGRSSAGRLFMGANDNNYASNNVVETRNVKGLQNGMKMRRLPGTDLVVSELCLGTMCVIYLKGRHSLGGWDMRV